LARRGYPIVDFGFDRVVVDEPLQNPRKVAEIEAGCSVLDEGVRTSGVRIRLDDGRILEVVEDGRMTLSERVLDLQSGVDGRVVIFKNQPAWFCANCRPRAPLIRIPLVPRTVYRNRKVQIGRGRILAETRLVGPS